MKRTLLALATAVALLAVNQTWAQRENATPASQPATAAKSAPAMSPEELEANFKSMLTKAQLSGRWASIKDGTLGPEKEDKYEIVDVSKVSGDSWVVNAKMKYGEREFVVPIPVQVKWAGDTAVIVVDNLAMPGGKRAYSARVLFYKHTYAGTWTGGEQGGLLSGIITSVKAEKPDPAK